MRAKLIRQISYSSAATPPGLPAVHSRTAWAPLLSAAHRLGSPVVRRHTQGTPFARDTADAPKIRRPQGAPQLHPRPLYSKKPVDAPMAYHLPTRDPAAVPEHVSKTTPPLHLPRSSVPEAPPMHTRSILPIRHPASPSSAPTAYYPQDTPQAPHLHPQPTLPTRNP